MKVTRKSKIISILTATEKQANRAVTAGAKEAEAVMNQLVPVDEGDLKSTIEVTDDGFGHAKIEAGGKSKVSEKTVDYAAHVEYGTAHGTADGGYTIPAQPFFRPGLDSGRRKLRSEMKIADK